MTTSYDIKLFEKIHDTYPKYNIKYVPNIIKQKKSGPKQREINRDTIITGNCVSDKCENQFDKSFREVVDPSKGPYCTICSKKRGNDKRKETKSSSKIIHISLSVWGRIWISFHFYKFTSLNL